MRLSWKSVVAVASFLMLWEAASGFHFVSEKLFPPPTLVVIAIKEIIRTGELQVNVAVSLRRVAFGLVLGCFSGVLVGLVTGRAKNIDAFISPVIQLLRPLPPVAIIPLVIVWLGIGELAKVWSISFAVFFPVWVGTHQGARTVPQAYLWAAKSLRLGEATTFLQVILPAALPLIVSGVRSGVAISFVMVFVSELAGASAGIGYAINTYQLAYRTDFMMAYLVVLGALGATCDQLVSRLIRSVFPWLGFIES
jgi:ABC-type nitrate/sulfonate/bicarbonate transport system permease component